MCLSTVRKQKDINSVCMEDGGWPEFQGAIIMDTILNFNSSLYSQILPQAWVDRVPDTSQQVSSLWLLKTRKVAFQKQKGFSVTFVK